MTLKTFLAATALSAGMLVSSTASADIGFTFTSESNADFASFSFILPDAFVPASFDDQSFTTPEVTTDSSTRFGPVTLIGTSYTFYNAAGFGGFDSGSNSYFGPVLFRGTTANPTFLNGTFVLNDGVTNGTLVITGAAQAPAPSSGAVPEPATWAMMLVGFGMIGFGMRARRNGKITTKVAFA